MNKTGAWDTSTIYSRIGSRKQMVLSSKLAQNLQSLESFLSWKRSLNSTFLSLEKHKNNINKAVQQCLKSVHQLLKMSPFSDTLYPHVSQVIYSPPREVSNIWCTPHYIHLQQFPELTTPRLVNKSVFWVATRS
jgi:hypothetical protein